MKHLSLRMLPFLLLAGCAQTSVDTEAEKEAVMQTSRAWNKAATSRNTDSTLSYWTDDALVLSPGQQPLKGKEAIRQMVASGFENPGFSVSWEPQSGEVSKCGDMAYLIEDSKMNMKDSAGNDRVQNFKTVTIWRKQENGKWKAVVDVMSPLPQ